MTPDPGNAVRATAEAQKTRDRAMLAARMPGDEPPGMEDLSGLVLAMLRRPMFGPRGAVRAGTLVPRPRVLRHVPVPGADSPGGRRHLLTLELLIDSEGRVVRVFPVNTSEGYDSPIARAVSQWLYEPTRLHGEPVTVIHEITVLVRWPIPRSAP